MAAKSTFDPAELHVISVISNPVRFESRYRLYKQFEKEMKLAGVSFYTAEAAFGNRPHFVTEPDNPKHLQLRTTSEIWHKENLINLMAQRLPPAAKYIAWVDADISFLRPDWAQETIEQLQHYPVVQMFETAVDLGPTGSVMNTYKGYAASALEGLPFGPGAGGSYGQYWHSGYSWGITKMAFNELGGLPDFAILGAGDHHFANALYGRAEVSLPANINKNYATLVFGIQERAKAAYILNNVGCTPGAISHHWHGKKKNRQYVERWSILQKWDYDPLLDISRDNQGLYQFTKRGLRMENDFRQYFRSRLEDSVDLE